MERCPQEGDVTRVQLASLQEAVLKGFAIMFLLRWLGILMYCSQQMSDYLCLHEENPSAALLKRVAQTNIDSNDATVMFPVSCADMRSLGTLQVFHYISSSTHHQL